MGLTTEFDGISSNDIDARIDALHSKIHVEMQNLTQELRKVQGAINTTANWYAQNLVELSYEAVNRNKAPAQADIEARMPVSVDESVTLDPLPLDGEKIAYEDYLEKKMSYRPKGGFLTVLSGEAKAEKKVFLQSLKEDGDFMIDFAMHQVESARQHLKKEHDAAWKDFIKFYVACNDLRNSTAEKDLDGVIATLINIKDLGLPGELFTILITRPLGEDTIASAFATVGESVTTDDKTISLMLEALKDKPADAQKLREQYSRPSAQEELASLVKIMRAVGDDAVGIRIITDFLQRIEDSKKQEIFEAFITAFNGNFLIAGHNTLINSSAIVTAGKQDGDFFWNVPGGQSGINDQTLYDFTDIENAALDAQLAPRDNYVSLTDNLRLNTDYLVGIKYDKEKSLLSYKTIGGVTGCVEKTSPADTQTAVDILGKIRRKPGFIFMPDASFANSAHVSMIIHAPGSTSLQWAVQGGRGNPLLTSVTGTEDDCAQIVKDFLKREDMLTIDETHTISSNVIQYLSYDNLSGTLNIELTGSYKGFVEFSIPMTVAQFKSLGTKTAFNAASGESVNFVTSGANIINLDQLLEANYDMSSNALTFTFAGGEDGARDVVEYVSEKDAAKLMAKLATTPGFVTASRAEGTTAINSKHLQVMEYAQKSQSLSYVFDGGQEGYIHKQINIYDIDLGNQYQSDNLAHNGHENTELQAKAANYINALSDIKDFVRISNISVQRAENVLSAWYKDDKLHLEVAGGINGSYCASTSMRQTEARSIMKEISTKVPMVTLGSMLLRIDRLVSAHYDAGNQMMHWQFPGSPAGTSDDHYSVAPEEAKIFFDKVRTFGQMQQIARENAVTVSDVPDLLSKKAKAEKKSARKNAYADELKAYLPWQAASLVFAQKEAKPLVLENTTVFEDAGRAACIFDVSKGYIFRPAVASSQTLSPGMAQDTPPSPKF